MAFGPTPPRPYLPAQLLPLSSITSTVIQQSGSGSSGLITITNPPTDATAGTALSLTGTVSPSAAVRVGLSSSSSTPPANWTNATVLGAGWTVLLTPADAGTSYIWAEQTATPSVQAVSAAITVTSGSLASITLTSPPTTGTTGAALALAGTVSPSATAIQVGLSSSSGSAPSSWTAATVSGTGWTATLTPAAAGTYFIWAEQTATPSVQVVSAAVVIASAGGSPLSYSLISGSGNASLAGVTLSTYSSGSAPAVNWTSSIVHGSADVSPNALISALGSITACKFWFDTTNTGVSVPSNYGIQASFNNGVVAFYAFADGFGTPTCVPAAPGSAGTYYGKYAFYDTGGTLLGVFTTSAITVT
jgi:hypothetical protein